MKILHCESGCRAQTFQPVAGLRRLLALWLSLALLPTLHAQVILYDGFAYPSGSSLEGNGNTNFAWGTNLWLKHYADSDWLVCSNSLSHPSIRTTGGHVAETNNSQGADYERKFAPFVLQEGAIFWFSFLVRVTQGASWDLFFTSSGLNSNKFGVTGNYPNYGLRALLGVGYNGSVETIDLGQNTTRLIVGRFRHSEFGFDQLDVWADPDIAAEPVPGGTSSSNHIVHLRQHNLQPAQIDSVLLETRSLGSLAFDELRVAGSWDDVIEPGPQAVRIDQIATQGNQITLDLSRLTPGATTTIQRATHLLAPPAWEDVDIFVPSARATNRVHSTTNAGSGFYRIRTE